MEVSVVVPAHNEAGNLERLVEATTEVLDSPSFGHEYELLLVDDNSTDDTPAVCVWDEIAREVAEREDFEEFPLHLKDVVDTLDKESWDILTQCRLYVDTYTRVGIDTDFRQAQLKEEEHRIFRAVMQWLLEDDVWSWMEQVKRDREKKNASREESTS